MELLIPKSGTCVPNFGACVLGFGISKFFGTMRQGVVCLQVFLCRRRNYSVAALPIKNKAPHENNIPRYSLYIFQVDFYTVQI